MPYSGYFLTKDALFQIYVSKKWGFTKWNREDYEKMREEGRLRPDGANVQYLPEHGPLATWCKIQASLAGL
jgi:large subunit ribosomal protein L10e